MSYDKSCGIGCNKVLSINFHWWAQLKHICYQNAESDYLLETRNLGN